MKKQKKEKKTRLSRSEIFEILKQIELIKKAKPKAKPQQCILYHENVLAVLKLSVQRHSLTKTAKGLQKEDKL